MCSDDEQQAAAEQLTGRRTGGHTASARRREADGRRREAEAAAARPEATEDADWLDATALALVQTPAYTLLYDKYILGLPAADLMARHGIASQATLARRVETLLTLLRSNL